MESQDRRKKLFALFYWSVFILVLSKTSHVGEGEGIEGGC